MGRWKITIEGTGCHHNNRDGVSDADVQARQFHDELRASGHQIHSATFEVIGAENGVTDLTGGEGQVVGSITAETEAEPVQGVDDGADVVFKEAEEKGQDSEQGEGSEA